MLHTVVTCDLSQPALRCRAREVLGPRSHSFYVSSDAVYVWVTPDRWGRALHAEHSVVYRLPLDEAAPIGALRAGGFPIDQFAFREADGHLSVLLHMDAGGLALMRVPLVAFTDGATVVPPTAFTAVPAATGGRLHVRYLGYELVEGRFDGDEITEVSRTNLYEDQRRSTAAP